MILYFHQVLTIMSHQYNLTLIKEQCYVSFMCKGDILHRYLESLHYRTPASLDDQIKYGYVILIYMLISFFIYIIAILLFYAYIDKKRKCFLNHC